MRSKFWLWVVLSALLFAAPDVGAASSPDQAELSAKFAAANEAYDRQDYARSFALFREIAEQGDAAAQFNVGNMYKAGKGVAASDAEAVKWFRLAAGQKVGLAQLALGVMYAEGRGVPRNYAEAVRWNRLAASQGVALADYNLGVAYHAGQGVARNDAEARKWFLLAAQAGDPGGQASLGRMYANGEGGPKDPVKGYIWYSVAADGGDQRSADARDGLEETMTADQVAAARDTAMRCSQSKGKECE